MTTGLLDPPMADEKPRTMSVKLPMDVIESARIVSAYRGESMADLMADILRPVLSRMEQEEIARRTQATQAGAKRKAGGK